MGFALRVGINQTGKVYYDALRILACLFDLHIPIRFHFR